MTALALRNKIKDVHIKLIEDPTIGAIGVGESTTPPVMRFIEEQLELNPKDWIPHTNASFKVGTEFVGWSDEKFYSTFKVMSDYDQVKESWFIKKINYPDTPLSDFFETVFPSVLMIQGDKFDIDLDKNAWAVHFNAGLFGEYLKDVSIERGVEYIEGRVDTIQKDDIGNIVSLTLLTGDVVESDLFVDCTGFGSVLAKSYDNKFLSVDEYLPNNKALVVRKSRKDDEEISVCTRANTGTAGWIWEIPMRTETAIGYVHCPDFISLEDAKKELLEFSGMPADSDILEVNFRSGRFEKQWVKNCVTVGLSGGFLEPLESTGLWFTVHGINMLISSLSHVNDQTLYHNPTRELYNREFAGQFDSVSSFIQLHYIGAHRNDTPYWKYVTEELEGNEDMIEGLMNVMHHGPHTYIPGFFDTYLWSGITMGLGLTKAEHWLGRGMNEYGDQDHINRLDANSALMRQSVRGMKSHRIFLEEFLHD
jgi:tryptophan halogenase